MRAWASDWPRPPRIAADVPGPGVCVQVHSVGNWWEASPDAAVMRIAEQAVHEEWGVAPLLVRLAIFRCPANAGWSGPAASS